MLTSAAYKRLKCCYYERYKIGSEVETFDDERLYWLGLTTLKESRRRGNLIETYKFLSGKNLSTVASSSVLMMVYTIYGVKLQVYKDRSHLNVRKFFFSQRVVDSWNKLSAHVVEAETVNCFKRRLDECSSWGIQSDSFYSPTSSKSKSSHNFHNSH